MKLTAAFLADTAVVREGLLYALGGGINQLHRTDYPALLSFTVVLMFEVSGDEPVRTHRFAVLVETADGERLLEMGGELGAKANSADSTANVPLIVPMPPLAVVPRAGHYAVHVNVDGDRVASLPFAVRKPRKKRSARKKS